jgi:cysteinyl-tRNA synthetase
VQSNPKISLYNTLSRTKKSSRRAKPVASRCMSAASHPYDALHIGHARAFMAYDVCVEYSKRATTM